MSKHTPGPWHVESDGGLVYVLDNTLDQVICEAGGIERSPDAVDFANARIIAAAPDLLEALVALSDYGLHGENSQVPLHLQKIICNAINKATGGIK